MDPHSSRNERTRKTPLSLKREPEELVIEDDFNEDEADAELTVAQGSSGESLTLLEEYHQRSGSSHRWTLAFNALCAITTLAFTFLTLQKL